MKKYLALLLCLCTTLFTACGASPSSSVEQPVPTQNASDPQPAQNPVKTPPNTDDQPETETAMRIAALKGPTAMGMVKLMSGAQQSGADEYAFTIAASADEITPKIVQGELDIAAVPANLASVLYNKTEGAVQVLAVNTLGVLYIVESGETVSTVEDLRGKTIFASGKGATPEYALNYVLQANGIDPEKDVTIEWKSEHTECAAALASTENAIALLPQPFATTVQMKNDKVRVALDLNDLWEQAQRSQGKTGGLLTGVIIGRREFVEANPEAVSAFLDSYKSSVEYVNANTDDAAALIEKYDIVPAAVAKTALPKCNITFIEGDEMQQKLSGYLTELMSQNPAAVGGALPADDFYYKR